MNYSFRPESAVAANLEQLRLSLEGNMKTTFLAVLIVFGLIQGSISALAQADSATLYVSFVSVLTNPESFSGRSIAVFGYLSGEDANPYLYLTRDHAEHRDVLSSVLVLVPSEVATRCGRQYVRIIGMFTNDPEPMIDASAIESNLRSLFVEKCFEAIDDSAD